MNGQNRDACGRCERAGIKRPNGLLPRDERMHHALAFKRGAKLRFKVGKLFVRKRIEITERRVVVVRARIYHAVFAKIRGQVGVVGVAVEGELDRKSVV